MRLPTGLLVGLLFAACNRPCVSEELLLGLDGGQVPCVMSNDCPRPANVLLCGSLEDRLFDCVDCTATLCVRYRGEVCR
jgi:hypothetical protein